MRSLAEDYFFPNNADFTTPFGSFISNTTSHMTRPSATTESPGAGLFTPAPVDMLNDLFLVLSVVALVLVIWLVVLLIKDPKGVVKSALFGKK